MDDEGDVKEGEGDLEKAMMTLARSTIRMALGDGHQAIQDTAIGKTRYDAGKKMVVLDDIQRFPAECVNPPANMRSEEWIKGGFPGAKGCP